MTTLELACVPGSPSMLFSMAVILRGHIFHTPHNPFENEDALAVMEGALALLDGRVGALGSLAEVQAQYPDAPVLGDGQDYILPGFVDTHVHYPQVSVVGTMGVTLLQWLETRTLPEEARLSDTTYARGVAETFLRGLARNGTTTALVFGAHQPAAQAAFFEAAASSGLRLTSGLVWGDRLLRPELEADPETCYSESEKLIAAWHNHGRLRYAVTPRFALSCSEAVLAAAGALAQRYPDVLIQTHLNESPAEIAQVAELFPWAKDYLETYERFGLVTERSVFAHNVHVLDGELERLGAARSCVAHCPSSNMFIGSGLFDMKRHLAHGVRTALGSDVGGGTGFSLFKEGLMSYQGQMLHSDGFPLGPAHLLYLATRAGALALGLGEVGDLSPGQQADFMLVRPPEGSTLADVLAQSPSAEASLGALFTLAREESVREVFVAGEPLFTRLGLA